MKAKRLIAMWLMALVCVAATVQAQNEGTTLVVTEKLDGVTRIAAKDIALVEWTNTATGRTMVVTDNDDETTEFDWNEGISVAWENVSDDVTAMHLTFIPNGGGVTVPIECEHWLEASSMVYSADGICLTVNGESVEYPFGIVEKMTFINGTPSVTVPANEDPDNEGHYYATFYSGLETYSLPDEVKAYTAVITEGDGEKVVKLTRFKGNILPKGTAVLLYSTETYEMQLTASSENVDGPEQNLFCGVDVETYHSEKNYMLSYGQYRLGFYKMNEEMNLSPNKAYIPMPSIPSSVSGLRMVFAEDDVDGMEWMEDEEQGMDGPAIYNLQGVRLSELQKGINIVNGQKIIVK